MRVGKRYFVQTPNKRFPLEPHFLFPFFQYLPSWLRAQMVHRFDVGWYKRIPDYSAAKAEVDSIQLLTRRKFSRTVPQRKASCREACRTPKIICGVRWVERDELGRDSNLQVTRRFGKRFCCDRTNVLPASFANDLERSLASQAGTIRPVRCERFIHVSDTQNA